MISSHYWFGVVFIYFGLLLCFLECCYEPRLLRRPHWVWLSAVGTLIALTTIFSIMVPLARAPLEALSSIRPGEYPRGTTIAGIDWDPQLTEVRLILNNPTDMDYENMDIVLEPNEPIVKIGQVSNAPGVSFVGDVTKEQVDIGGVIAVLPELTRKDPDGRVINIPLAQILTPRYHVVCQTLPKKRSIQLVIAIARLNPKQDVIFSAIAPAGHDGDTSQPSTIFAPRNDYSRVVFKRVKPTKIRIYGTYTAAFRQRAIDETIAIFAPAN